jgi:signal transduction histidine kinase
LTPAVLVRLGRTGRLLRSTSARLVLLVFGLQLVLAGLAMAWAWANTSRQLASADRALVAELSDELIATWRLGGSRQLAGVIARLGPAQHARGMEVLLADRQGEAVAGTLDGWPAGMARSPGWAAMLLETPSGGQRAFTALATPLGGGQWLLVAHDDAARADMADTLLGAIVTALLLAVPLALLLAVLLARLSNARLQSLRATVAAVSGGDLSRRVWRDDSEDAYDALGGAVNVMLDRIQRLVDELRIITDGLAHDLRSPLTRLKSRLEAARHDTQDAAALAALDEVTTETDQLMAMLATALQISRAEAGIGRDHMADVDVDALLADVVEVYGPSAEDAGIALELAPGRVGRFRLHRQLIQQALGNLIENALNHAAGASCISVAASRDGEGMALLVTDDGPGIPADRRAEARSRFGRLDAARHVHGSGLGLALVEAVARLHNGRLDLTDGQGPPAQPGLSAVMRLA